MTNPMGMNQLPGLGPLVTPVQQQQATRLITPLQNPQFRMLIRALAEVQGGKFNTPVGQDNPLQHVTPVSAQGPTVLKSEPEVFYTNPWVSKLYGNTVGPYEIIKNPSVSDVERIEKEARKSSNRLQADDRALVRIVRDEKGNMYVGKGNEMLHEEMIKAIEPKVGGKISPAGNSLTEYRFKKRKQDKLRKAL